MFIKVLGSAAGGGFPQWNCNCANCQGLRNGTIQASARTQSSIIVSDNGKEWVLCNASPDISQQIAHTPELNKPGVLRGTSIGGIILTDSQIDHTTGLLSLREGCPHQVWCTPEVHEDLSTGFPVFTMLRHWNGGLVHHPIAPQQPFTVDACPTGRCRVITWRCLSKTAATGRRCSMPRGWVSRMKPFCRGCKKRTVC